MSKPFIPWKGRLKRLKFRGLFFTWGKPLTFMFPEWKAGWESTQMNEFLFLGYCYLSWSM